MVSAEREAWKQTRRGHLWRQREMRVEMVAETGLQKLEEAGGSSLESSEAASPAHTLTSHVQLPEPRKNTFLFAVFVLTVPGQWPLGFNSSMLRSGTFLLKNNNEMLKMFSKTRVISTQPVWNWLFPAGLSDLFWLVPLKVKSPYEMLSKSHLTYAAPC